MPALFFPEPGKVVLAVSPSARGIFPAVISVAGLCHEFDSKSLNPLHFISVCWSFVFVLARKQQGRGMVRCMESFLAKGVSKHNI